MWTKPTTPSTARRHAWLGLACLSIGVLSAGPALAQPLTPPNVQALDQQIAVKKASLDIAVAQKAVAEAKVNIVKASVQTAKANVARWEAEAKRANLLQTRGVYDRATVDETELQLKSAKAALVETEARLTLAEREVAVEDARRKLAEVELTGAQTRRDQAAQPADPLPKLLQARLDAAKKVYTAKMNGIGEVGRMPGPGTFVVKVQAEEVYTWSVRWLSAQREMSAKKADQIAALEAHVQRMKELQKKIARMVPEILPDADATAAAWYVAEAEVWLAKEK